MPRSPQSSGDALVTLIPTLAGLLGALLLVNYLFELKRSSTHAASTEWRARTALLMVLAALVGLALRGGATWSPSAPDFFESKRAGGVAAIGAAALMLGFAWPRVVGLALERTAILFTLGAGPLLAVGWQPASDFLFGNSGYDMQVLLPGAALALARLTRERDRILSSTLAFLSAALFAAMAPVVGGALVLAILAALALATCQRRGRMAALLGVALVALITGARGTFAPTSASAAAPSAEAQPTDQLGGVGVRLAIWETLLDAPKSLDFGVGQFQAAYPPLRSSKELAASTGNHTIEAITEVEHPHNDLLLAWAEGRGAWPLGLGLGLLAILALASLGRPDARPLALGALALVLAGSFHAPLLVNPLAATLGWGLAGAFAGSLWQGATWPSNLRQAAANDLVRKGGVGDLAGRLIGGAIALLLVGQTFDWAPLNQTGATPESSLEAAREGRLAFDTIAARARAQTNPTEARLWWSLALKLRPHSIEALSGHGLSQVQTGDLLAANTDWHAALRLDPAYPVVKNNLERLGADLILAGHLQPGLDNLAQRLGRAGLAAPLRPKDLEALSTQQEPPFKTALLAAAAWLHGRELFDSGSTSKALFELRRAAVIAGHGAEPKAGLGAEIAVLMSLEGQVAEARDRLARLGDTEAEREALIAELPERLQGAARLLWR